MAMLQNVLKFLILCSSAMLLLIIHQYHMMISQAAVKTSQAAQHFNDSAEEDFEAIIKEYKHKMLSLKSKAMAQFDTEFIKIVEEYLFTFESLLTTPASTFI